MRTVNIHKAKTHLSRLVDQAATGEPFIIAKAGKPLVKVVPLDAPSEGPIRRLGFMPISRYRMTSIPCAKTKSKRCFMAKKTRREAAA